ncbi:hypothetical protein BDV98DRAFT_338236 [Pterulicium gracile]|uniref:Uncharacterized protein n=1 Tax=Pterulicium gracile TaxID=1884261 RepID=A0A5C3QCK9_9AGAR|nr:hypothetical protein BDV98DRAFT_338236 [Pterula gracilis]
MMEKQMEQYMDNGSVMQSLMMTNREQRERSMKGKDKLSKDEKTGASPQKEVSHNDSLVSGRRKQGGTQ